MSPKNVNSLKVTASKVLALDPLKNLTPKTCLSPKMFFLHICWPLKFFKNPQKIDIKSFFTLQNLWPLQIFTHKFSPLKTSFPTKNIVTEFFYPPISFFTCSEFSLLMYLPHCTVHIRESDWQKSNELFRDLWIHLVSMLFLVCLAEIMNIFGWDDLIKNWILLIW